VLLDGSGNRFCHPRVDEERLLAVSAGSVRLSKLWSL
jgi:hypothetical protein